MTISTPPALVTNIICPANTTLAVAEPTGNVTGTAATATVALNGGVLTATVTDG